MTSKIGEIVAGSVRDGLTAKLAVANPEDLEVGFPVIVEGQAYRYFCLVENVYNEESDIADELAGSVLSEAVAPIAASATEGFNGPVFYAKAHLRQIQRIAKADGRVLEPQTIPGYFSECRHATREDVELIYERTAKSAALGTIRGVEPFDIHLDFERLTQKPFAVFGRTGAGKSVLNKLICLGTLATDASSILLFDMHSEYGMYSAADGSKGLKYFFPDKVEIYSLDGKTPEASPFILDTREITPADILVSLQDLSGPMIDTLYAIDRWRRGKNLDLIAAADAATVADLGENEAHEMALSALKRRMSRLKRIPFLREGKDSFGLMMERIRSGKSVVLDFGDYGTDAFFYLFVANVVSRRLFEAYTERNEELPRLTLFLEEAHKFLGPEVASFTIFGRLARETRKFNLILALVDQRPLRISDEVTSQLANRLVLSLKDPMDLERALSGVAERAMWESIVRTIPVQVVAVIGDAIRIPTVLNVLEYSEENIVDHILGGRPTAGRIREVARDADDLLGRGASAARRQ